MRQQQPPPVQRMRPQMPPSILNPNDWKKLKSTIQEAVTMGIIVSWLAIWAIMSFFYLIIASLL